MHQYYAHGEFERVFKFLGIKMAPSTTYHLEANGIAESKVKALKALLRSLAKQARYNRDYKLPLHSILHLTREQS